jgi:putative transposase
LKERVEEVCTATGASIRLVCATLEINRSTLYRQRQSGRPKAQDTTDESAVVEALKEYAGRFPTYGYRRLKVLVSRKLDKPVNAKRVRRLMHEHDLVTAKRTARARPQPHPREVEATAPDQVWQMDFTKIEVAGRWHWLLVVLDRFTREIVGWNLSLRGRGQEVTTTLKRAILDRFPDGVREAGLKIASDNGSAFLSQAVLDLAKELGLELMRTRVRYPEGNGRCERVIRTIKEEEVWLNVYETFDQAQTSLAEFLDFYNTKRMHSAFGYISPSQFAARWRSGDSPGKAA